MILDAAAGGTLTLPANPLVVVGSGAAGIPLALALADRGHRVVLLESGGDVSGKGPIPGFAGADSEEEQEQPFTGLDAGRARILGGTTQLWAGQCMRLFDLDLAPRTWIPHSGWPLTLSDLGEGYRLAERFLDVSGKGYGEDRWVEWPGRPVAWNPDHLSHTFTEFARRRQLGTVYRRRLAQNRNLWVVLHATVGRVRTDAGRVAGVELAFPDGRRLAIDAHTVVLAAGTIENSRILQLSDPQGVGLGTGREHTGRFFQDHPIIRMAEVVAPDHRYLQDRYGRQGRAGRRLWAKVRLAAKAQAEWGLLDAGALFDHVYDPTTLAAARRVSAAARSLRPPARGDVVPVLRALPLLARGLYRTRVLGRHWAVHRPAHVWIETWVEQAPRPDRLVTLAGTRDPLGLHQATVHWRCDDDELVATRQLTRWIAEDLERLGLARIRELPAMWDDDAWRATVRDGFHPAGTTRMADDPRRGVVDRNLQVHGVHGLYVAGASTFPTSGYANPTLTVVALALRLAAHLGRELGGQG